MIGISSFFPLNPKPFGFRGLGGLEQFRASGIRIRVKAALNPKALNSIYIYIYKWLGLGFGVKVCVFLVQSFGLRI